MSSLARTPVRPSDIWRRPVRRDGAPLLLCSVTELHGMSPQATVVPAACAVITLVLAGTTTSMHSPPRR